MSTISRRESLKVTAVMAASAAAVSVAGPAFSDEGLPPDEDD